MITTKEKHLYEGENNGAGVSLFFYNREEKIRKGR